jgi:DNA-binding MarR family transcriptional regulator
MTTLKQALNKKNPFDSAEQETMLNLWRTSDLTQNRFGRLFREYGITASQYNVLRILRGVGRPMPCLDIAGQMIQAVPAITRVIDQMDAGHLIRRRRCEEDRRVVYVELAPKGRRLLQKLDGPVLELHNRLLRHLSAGEIKGLNTLLEQARTELE